MKRKSRYLAIAVALCLLLTGIHPVEVKASGEFAAKPKYLRSATYFSDDWAINFWNSESKNMEQEMARISADGFNSIILVVPWREFQPEMSPATYNTYAFDKLDRIMASARDHGLWVSLRIGYTWDYYSGEDVTVRYEQLLSDKTVQAAWIDYVETIYETVSAYPNLYGGFLTWEDFWNFTHKVTGMTRHYDRIQYAGICGYTKYLKENYTLSELTELYEETIKSYEQAYLPRFAQPAMKLFYEFYDDFLNRLLADSQQVFPGLSMEVRLDGEPLIDVDGSSYYYQHYSTYECQGAPYTAAMYSVSMRQANNYEKIDAASAIASAVVVLDDVLRHSQGKKLYLEQYLFMDTTTQFSYNAQIKEEQRADFILGMVPILKSRVMGYGLWVYQNYSNNLLYNSQFGLGEAGWQLSGNCQIEEKDGTPVAKLSSDGLLKQKITGRISAAYQEPVHVRFTADSDSPCYVTVGLGRDTQRVKVEQKGTYKFTFPNPGAMELVFQSNGGTAYIDDVNVYTYEQDGQIYDMEGNPLSCLEPIQIMNRQLR